MWGRAWASSYNMHMNRLSFTLKWWAETVAFMSVIYAWPLPEAISTRRIILYGQWAACRWWSACSCCVSLNLRRLHYGCQCCTLAVAPQLPCKCTRTFNFLEYLNAHLEFMVYGRSTVGHIHTHLCNAVPLVWGSLRFAPIKCWAHMWFVGVSDVCLINRWKTTVRQWKEKTCVPATKRVTLLADGPRTG